MAKTTPSIDRSREGTVLAPALYADGAVRVTGDGVEIIGRPLRGEVRLISCYTPAWWYAVCSKCYWQSMSSDDEYDTQLVEDARAHRCPRVAV